MSKKIKCLALAALFCQLLPAQNIPKLAGPLGIYHIATGYTYTDTTGTDSLPLDEALAPGELNIPNQSFDPPYKSSNPPTLFQQELDSCVQWNANRVFGILQPPTEHGVYNQPNDTALYMPYAQLNGPGMIQGAQRFSKLSQLYGGVCGVILDDWNGNIEVTGQIRDAVQGKYVDDDGNVYSNTFATTPYNKLYCVIYGIDSNPSALPVIDGVSYWFYQTQNCCYTQLDTSITQLRGFYPGKEIIIGIYLRDSYLGWADPASVQYMLQHALDRYDDGDINGITLFSGAQLITDNISLSQWSAFALPYWLDSLYYPYLGQGQGKIYDCSTGNVLSDAFVHVFCKGPVSGDTLMRSCQKTDTNGQYQFGLWAGNRNTDSIYYWLIVEKSGYVTDTVGFWIKRLDTTGVANLSLCPASPVVNNSVQISLYPNPFSSSISVVLQKTNLQQVSFTISNLLGQKLYTNSTSNAGNTYAEMLNLTSLANGIYVLRVVADGESVVKEIVKQ